MSKLRQKQQLMTECFFQEKPAFGAQFNIVLSLNGTP
jgi:hypothetical protein